jgi:hypothetical protein
MDLVQRDGSCVSYLTGLGRSHSFSDSFLGLLRGVEALAG